MGEEVNHDVDADGVCMCVWQGSMAIMLISHFLSGCSKNTFFSHHAGQSSATYAAHFYATARVVRGDRNLGIRSIMDGGLLIRVKEREGKWE